MVKDVLVILDFRIHHLQLWVKGFHVSLNVILPAIHKIAALVTRIVIISGRKIYLIVLFVIVSCIIFNFIWVLKLKNTSSPELVLGAPDVFPLAFLLTIL